MPKATNTTTVTPCNVVSFSAKRREREGAKRAIIAAPRGGATVITLPRYAANLRRARNQRITAETNEHRADMQRLDAAMAETFKVCAKFAECPSDATYAAAIRVLCRS